jgi:hypothetical protein
MSREVINIYSARGDARTVRQLLLTRYPHATDCSLAPDEWTEIDITYPDGKRVRVLHDASFYTGNGWENQKRGMMKYFERWPLGSQHSQLEQAVSAFQFALAVRFEPESGPEDDRLVVVRELAEHLNGVLFSPTALRDPHFRVLVAADGQTDPAAQWPAIELLSVTPCPHSPLRIARRAVALLFLSLRGLLERDSDTQPHTDVNYSRLQEWTDELSIDDEFEPWEWETIRTLPGQLAPQMAANAGWRVEGLAVLAWALYRGELPRYDQVADADLTWDAIGYLHEAKIRELWANPIVRTRSELEAYYRQMKRYHHRLLARWEATTNEGHRSEDDPSLKSQDWAALGQVDGELALRGVRLDRVSPELLGTCLSIARERHQAISWLCLGPDRYSDAAT